MTDANRTETLEPRQQLNRPESDRSPRVQARVTEQEPAAQPPAGRKEGLD